MRLQGQTAEGGGRLRGEVRLGAGIESDALGLVRGSCETAFPSGGFTSQFEWWCGQLANLTHALMKRRA